MRSGSSAFGTFLHGGSDERVALAPDGLGPYSAPEAPDSDEGSGCLAEPARERLKVGILLPHVETRYGGATARWGDLLSMTRLAEDAGFDSVWTVDHFTLPDHGVECGVLENFSLLAAIAAVTSRVEIGPMVACTGFRNPALTAKIAETIDEISGGRLILGLGAGWHAPEYRAMGIPFDHRVGRFEEALTIIHGLLQDGQIDFEGRFYTARECELRPRGPRPGGDKPHLPLLLGSSGERMLQVGARYCDQWNTFFSFMQNDPNSIPALREKVDAACRAAGRDPATMVRTASIMVGFPLPGERGRPDTPNVIKGSVEQIAEQCQRFVDEGISHLCIYLDPMTERGIEAFVPVLERLKAMDAMTAAR